MTILKYRRYIILYLVVLFAAFMRLCDSPPTSLWTDEFATYWVSSAPTVSECIARATPTQGQSPFFYVLEWGVLKMLPHDEFSVRLLSLASSLISVVLIFFLALIIFGKSGPFYNSESENERGEPDLNSDAFFPAIFAALMFSISETAIYYAQEARPYAMAVMFALLSQIFFLLLLRKYSKRNILWYLVASSLIFYTHYIFGTLVVMQNLWMLYLFIRAGKGRKAGVAEISSLKDRVIDFFNIKTSDISLRQWCILQISLIVTLLPLLFHLMPILKNGDKWNWVPKGDFSYLLKLVNDMIDVKTIFFACSLLLLLLTFKNFLVLWMPSRVNKVPAECGRRVLSSRHLEILSFLLLWFVTPLLFAYFATQLLSSSLMDQRYLILIFIPYFLLGSLATAILRSKTAKYIFIVGMVVYYFVQTLMPNFLDTAHFAPRISHNWRYALHVLKAKLSPGDSIVLRSGFVKENWIPTTDNKIIKEYVQAPLKSFYFKGIRGAEPAAVYNLTFSPLRMFESYYKEMAEKAAKSDIIWIIGIKQPNNFPLENIPGLFFDTHKMAANWDFDGVFLMLMMRK